MILFLLQKKNFFALMTPNFFKGMKEIKKSQAIQSSFFYTIALT